MSRILALDTSSDACSAALLIDGTVTERFSVIPREHTQRLLPMVDELLADHQQVLSQLDAIAFGRGPGSFTGLRICLGVVQGLAFGADLPVIPVSTLQVLALGGITDYQYSEQSRVLVALDARMSEVYWAEYRVEGQLPQLVTDEYVMNPADVAKELDQYANSNESVARYGLGPGWHYPDMAAVDTQSIQLEAHPHASCIARLADPLWQSGKAVSALDAQPTYLRDTVSWKKRQRIRSLPSSDGPSKDA
jgi:tRNA threonylcarbamoyladenosine biosynthesis protein TsaB